MVRAGTESFYKACTEHQKKYVPMKNELINISKIINWCLLYCLNYEVIQSYFMPIILHVIMI